MKMLNLPLFRFESLNAQSIPQSNTQMEASGKIQVAGFQKVTLEWL